MTHTKNSVSQMVKAGWEGDLPDRVIEALRKHDGKPITTRILKDLPALPNGATWRLVRNYGWTSLETSTYCKPEGYADKTSLSLILARSESSVPLDLAYVAGEKPIGNNSYGENGAYFAARRERNGQRLTVQKDGDACQKMADCLNDYAAALAALESARQRFEELTDYGAPFNVAKYEFEQEVDPDGKATHKATK